MKQTALALRSWGGKRRGAGRKPFDARHGIPHRTRAQHRPSQPVHVTIRLADHVWNLRSERSFAVIHDVLQAVRPRPGFRVAHFSIQGNHLHLIVETGGAVALAAGMRAFSIRLARGLNRMMGRSGAVLEDRFHAHVLRTPAEVRNALRYVLGNRANHLQRLGLPAERGRPDRYSSAVATPPRNGQLELWAEGPVSPSRTWLLRTAERGSRGESSTAQSGSLR